MLNSSKVVYRICRRARPENDRMQQQQIDVNQNELNGAQEIQRQISVVKAIEHQAITTEAAMAKTLTSITLEIM